MAEKIELSMHVPAEYGGKRFDQIAALCFSDYSRARLQIWIKDGDLLVDGQIVDKRNKLVGGELLEVKAEVENKERWMAEDIPLDIVYEDEAIIVVNKPAGLVVHPAAGNHDGTLLNALLHHFPDIASVPRAGIVHRLDKDTSGLMVVGKTLAAQTDLVEQLQERSVHREYEAVAGGTMITGGTVNEMMGRHPTHRIKMAVVLNGGKEAITHYRVVQRYRCHTHIRCKLETGRTHQIRVHMGHIKHPLVGDPLYAGRLSMPKGASQDFLDTLRHFGRQALHARQLGLYHPVTGEYMEWEADLPDDFLHLLEVLQKDEDDHNFVEDPYRKI